MPMKSNLPLLLSALILVLSNLELIRTFRRYGLRVGLRRVSKSARGIVHPLTWFKIVKVLAAPQTQPVVRAAPLVVAKYLGRYLGTDLSESERASILIDHYTFLKDRVEQGFFRKIVDGRLELWKHGISNGHVRICVAFPIVTHNEGDLSLIFQSDHVDIYTLSFTIGPGGVAGLAADHAIYIARIQGTAGELQLIRKATKDCLDISPAALLLAATEGVATALKLGHIVGIGADMQISPSAVSRPERLVHGYDEFWVASGGLRLDRNMYHLAVPLPEKPIKTVKRNHRSRALHKRAFRKLVKEQVCREFSAVALRPRDH
jgi:uncharacterized protein VirK/YbjX